MVGAGKCERGVERYGGGNFLKLSFHVYIYLYIYIYIFTRRFLARGAKPPFMLLIFIKMFFSTKIVV